MAVVTQIIDSSDSPVTHDPSAFTDPVASTASAVWQGGGSTRAQARRDAFPIEGDAQHEGVDPAVEPQGPTPTEYLLGALLGSITSLLHRQAQERGVVVGAIESSSRAHLAAGAADEISARRARRRGRPADRITGVSVRITLVTDGARADIDAIEREVLAACPILALLRDSGIDVDVDWENLYV